MQDLRGLTRPAISLALRADLRLTGEARELGLGACGHGGSWAIITGSGVAGSTRTAGVRAANAPTADAPTADAPTADARTADARTADARGSCTSSLRGAHTSPRAGGAETVTVQTARDFLEVEGVAFTRNKGYLLIEAAELERAAAEAATAARSQRVRQALLLYTSIVASGLAAMSIVPRLRVA